MAEKCIVVDC